MPMLKKMKMPKREEISIEELDMPEEEMMAEGEDEAPSMDEGKMADLAAISDEDLLAEMKKRGLMADISGEDMAAEGEEELDEYDDEEMMG